MKTKSKSITVSNPGMYFPAILRILIGWHFLYEGLVKLTEPLWTSSGYLEQSRYILPGLFHSIEENPGALAIVDFINIRGQILIGIALLPRLFTRIAAIAGAIHPNEAFRFAFENGADLICVGMYDFQMIQDLNIALDTLNDHNVKNRERPWVT